MTLRGLILTLPETRSGVSKKSQNPYAIQTVKILAGQRTFNWVQMRAEESELAPVPPIGMIVEIAVDSANRRTPDADLEINGEIRV